jgi:hypothetical protein
MPNIFKIALWTTLVSFIFGSLLTLSYYQTSKDELLFIGYAYTALAVLVNLIILIMVIGHAIRNKSQRKKGFLVTMIQLANVPVVVIYFIFIMNLLSVMRIQLINPSPTEMTDIYIEGCEEKQVEKLSPGESKTVWVHINGDCSISMKYNTAGLSKEETIMGYCSANMGKKIQYRIGEKNDPVF